MSWGLADCVHHGHLRALVTGPRRVTLELWSVWPALLFPRKGEWACLCL